MGLYKNCDTVNQIAFYDDYERINQCLYCNVPESMCCGNEDCNASKQMNMVVNLETVRYGIAHGATFDELAEIIGTSRANIHYLSKKVRNYIEKQE